MAVVRPSEETLMSEHVPGQLQGAVGVAGESPDLLPGGECRRRPAAAGWRWIADGFALFMKQPLLWVGVIVVLMIIQMVLSLVPLSSLLAPVFTGGLVLAARHCDVSANMQLGDLFAGFGQSFGRLFMIGLLWLLGMILIGIVAATVLMLSVGVGNLELLAASEDLAGDPALLAALGGGLFITLLVVAVLLAPLLMAYWFAPALVIFNPGRGAYDAMLQSLRGCLCNWLPLLVYGLILLPLFALAALTMGLGFLVLLPVVAASNYLAYKDVFFGID